MREIGLKGSFGASGRDRRVAIAFSLVLGLVVSSGLACSHDGTHDGTCTAPLAEVGAGCPGTYDGTEASLPCLRGLPFTQSRTCGGLIDLSIRGLYGGMNCFYDARSHELVGARIWSDIPEFCGDSFRKSAGRVAGASCDDLPWTVTRQCPSGP